MHIMHKRDGKENTKTKRDIKRKTKLKIQLHTYTTILY